MPPDRADHRDRLVVPFVVTSRRQPRHTSLHHANKHPLGPLAPLRAVLIDAKRLKDRPQAPIFERLISHAFDLGLHRPRIQRLSIRARRRGRRPPSSAEKPPRPILLVLVLVLVLIFLPLLVLFLVLVRLPLKSRRAREGEGLRSARRIRGGAKGSATAWGPIRAETLANSQSCPTKCPSQGIFPLLARPCRETPHAMAQRSASGAPPRLLAGCPARRLLAPAPDSIGSQTVDPQNLAESPVNIRSRRCREAAAGCGC